MFRNLLKLRNYVCFQETAKLLFRPNFMKAVPTTRFLLISNCAVVSLTGNLNNFDKELQTACIKGVIALADLMDNLEDQILEISAAYMECLKKQIAVIDEAIKSGPLSKKWDDLPEHRSIGNELSQTLTAITVALYTIKNIAEQEMSKVNIDQECRKIIRSKVDELEKILAKQSKEIKKLEDRVLKLNRESILQT